MAENRKDVLQPIDAQARCLARTLLRTARFAALATIDTADGAPVASRVAIATAMSGEPVFLISTLASHTANLAADQRCSIMVGEPGKGDPLATRGSRSSAMPSVSSLALSAIASGRAT